MDANTGTQANAGMLAMRARMAALSPDERKANAHKAAAASAAAAKARREAAKGAAATGGDPSTTGGRATEGKRSLVVAAAPRAFRVALMDADGHVAWVGVDAGGPQRASRQARKAHPGLRVLGCVERVLAGLVVG